MKINNYIYTDSEIIKNNEDILNTNESTRYYEISLKDDNSLLILKKVDEKTGENIPDNNFNISFYNKLKEYFNPLEIILEDKKFYVVNKDVFLKWYFSFDIYVNGKRKIIEKVGGSTKKEAIENGLKIQEKFFNSNKLFELKTIEDLINDYVQNYINLFLKDSTKKIRMYYFNIVKDEIGKVKLEKMNKKFFQSYILKKTDPSNLKKFLNSMFNYAVEMELITKNPVINIKIPKPKKRQFDLITENDIKIIQKMDIREITKDLISFIYLTGTRISEALGLKWSDIDFNNMTISIRRTINKNKRNTFDTPKTTTSERTILFNNITEKIFMNRKKDIEILKKNQKVITTLI